MRRPPARTTGRRRWRGPRAAARHAMLGAQSLRRGPRPARGSPGSRRRAPRARNRRCARPSPIHAASAAISARVKRLGAVSRGPRRSQECARQVATSRVRRPRCATRVAMARRRSDQRLQLHRRLPLVALDRANTEQRANRVEQPAQAGCRRRPRAAPRADSRHRRRLGNTTEAPRRFAAAAELMQHGDAHAPGLARRAVAAGQAAAAPDAPRRRHAAPSSSNQLAAPGAAVRRHIRSRRARRRARARASRAPRRSPRHARRDAARARKAGRRFRVARRDEIGMQVADAAHSGSTARIEIRCAIVSSRKRIVRRSSRSPICCETNASRPRVTVMVFFRSAADARARRGPSAAEIDRIGNEAARAPEIGGRAVDDAHHAVVGAHDDRARSWPTTRSAMPASGRGPPRRRPSAVRRRDWRWWRRARCRGRQRARVVVRRCRARVEYQPMQRDVAAAGRL